MIHSNINPDNIMIEMDKELDKCKNLILMNFGNSLPFNNDMHFSCGNHEYAPPEILNHLKNIKLHPENSCSLASHLFAAITPTSTDIWAMGMILIEIITGIPIWIPKVCKVYGHDKKTHLMSNNAFL